MTSPPRAILVCGALCLSAGIVVRVAGQAPVPNTGVAIGYRTEPLEPDTLRTRFDERQVSLLEKINRRDAVHLERLTEIILPDLPPDNWPQDELAFSPLPAVWPSAEALTKAILVHQPAQVFGAYEFGRLVRWGPVSTGRPETPTPSGRFNLTWKSRSRTSTDNAAWLLKWYFNFINSRGVSFHEFDLPGHPASHACVRLLPRDAMWLFEWGEPWHLSPDGRRVETPGSTVVIHGAVDSSQPSPWTSAEWWRTPLRLPEIGK